MENGIGAVVAGKVSSITKFGAFVSLPEGKSGLVHISEIAHTYVNDIREHLTEGQEVTVKILGIDGEGRINLSIKKATDPPPRPDHPHGGPPPRRGGVQPGPQSFEDKLKAFMSDSESKMSDLRQHSDKRAVRRRK
ncbi:MAG: S1 RNA-binding domain-containing protein [Oscillospiraceae bacterium]|jgi:S1 RNA binding domain protein|nr:S1 RNA-binding domain-containing protein [Oscillospiraceae bacterium]